MQSILETCQPRSDIITGSFNPEIFTASLSQVMDCYWGHTTPTHVLHTDAEQFFRDATYPTEGLRMALTEVFGRLAGDNTVPAIHRLETAFGGGKTHTLIALTHLGFRGRELAAETSGRIDTTLLPAPDEVAVVGVAGDELPVHKPQGADLVPYTLWGEIAYQVGGEALYRQVELELDLGAADWSLVTPQGANQRGWTGPAQVDPYKIESWVAGTLAREDAMSVTNLAQTVVAQHGDVPENAVIDAMEKLRQTDRLMTYTGLLHE